MDAGAAISIDDVSVLEGSNGATTASFTVSLSAPTISTVTVVAQTADGTATAGSDYTPVGPTMLTFSPGTTSQTFGVSVLGAFLSYLRDWPMGATIVCLFGVTVAVVSLSVRMKYVDRDAELEEAAAPSPMKRAMPG